MLDKLTPKQRKFLNCLAFCGIIGVGLLLVTPPSNPVNPITPSISTVENIPVASPLETWNPRSYQESIEQELAHILSRISGVGEVRVYATLERGPQIVPATNSTRENRRTEEVDQNAGVTRTTEEVRVTSTPITLRQQGEAGEVPLVLEEYEPLLRGVLIVAAGAEDPHIRYTIARAVQTVLQIPMYKVEVLSTEK